MKRLRILHSADFHFDREHQEQSLSSLQAFYAFGARQRVDLWVLAGDLFNRAVQNTESSGFPRLVRVLRRMLGVAPVAAVCGTPTHDLPGCYEALEQIQGEQAFLLLDSRRSGFLLGDGGAVVEIPAGRRRPEPAPGARLLVLGSPEPAADWFVDGRAEADRREDERAVREGLQAMLRRLGLLRRRYADIPCLFVYHGLVRGAALQSGQVAGQWEIAVGREDLAAVGADYYALGHIHLAQRIAPLAAYYPGSAYPVNWGERDAKSFNYVLLGAKNGTFRAQVEQVPYPHPPRRKLLLAADGGTDGGTAAPPGVDGEDLVGCQVWLEVQASREQAGRVDRRALLDRLYAAGAVPGSRVTLSVLPAETARAARIQEAHRLEDKLRVWVEVSGEPAGERLMAKARLLEAEAREEGLAPGGLHVRIRRLFLRGAIGIRKGQGREEILLDLDRYAPDLVALVGPNGAGKTTLIENMHPFPEMLTRAGKLQDHFYLRDSCRDLIFSDERTGDEYRALIRIDGQNPSGKVDYHLYRNGEPLTNGRREDYQRRVQELFGSLALFLRSAFVSQKPGRNHPDLSEATKGEKKALFRELAGLDYLQGYADAAREKARALEEEADQEGGRVERMREAIADLPQKRARLAELQDAMAARRSELAACEREEARWKDELRRLEELARENRERKSRLEELARQSQERIEDKKALQEQVERLRAEGSSRGEAETLLARYERLKAEEQRLSGEKTRILEERERILAGQRERQESLFRRERELERRRADLRCELAVLQERRAALAQRIEERRAGESEEISCPRCGHTFRPRGGPGAAGEAAARSRARAIDRQIRRREEALARQEEKAAERDDGGPPLPDPSRIERRLAVVRERLQRFHPQPAYSLLERIHAAEGRILETQQRITEIDERLPALQEETRELAGRLDERPEQAILPAERALQAAVERRGAVREDLIRLEQDIGHLREETGALESLSDRLERALQNIGRSRQETADWRLLERACGPDGIQALELDAMGPGIAEVANRLLQAAYGSRFQIEFRTTRMGGLGSRRRQIEDFQIWIFDLESAAEQLLETLSGGEAVWVKRAIYDAFGIIRDRNTGQRFLTAFQDEADGALDMEARLAYFQMLREAHRQSGRRHTIVITHSQEAQEMIPQRIVIGELESR